MIVEPRKHKAMEFVLNNFINNLDNRWCFVIFCSDLNLNFIFNIINKFTIQKQNRIKIIRFTENNINISDYNRLMTSESIYQYILTEIFLVFQTDTLILNKDKIYKFLNFDYVGAPWKSKGICGNGGLSLRKKTKMLNIIQNIKYKNDNEDGYFACNTQNKPTKDIAKEFSVETIYYDVPFGIHKCWAYSDAKNIMALYPIIHQLKSLQYF